MAEETEQMIWYSDVWSRRFVVWIAGMNPAGAEPSEWAVVYKCDQELRAQLGARFVDPEQQRRFTRIVSLVKKAYGLDDGETCLYRSDPGVTSDVVNPSDETEQMIWRSYVWSRRFVVWIAGMNPAGAEPSEWAVVYKCDQELRAQLGARFVDPEQQRRFARIVSLVKKAYGLDDGETCLYRSDPGVTSDVVNPSDETEQLIWRSYVWSRRLVVWIAGMNPAGVEPSERAVVSKCGQELRAQFGARFADLEQQCRFARLVSLVKKAYDLDDGETCFYRSDSGGTFDAVNLSSHKTADADEYWTSWGDTASLSENDEPFCDVAEAVVSDALAKSLLAYTAQEEATDEMYAARHEEVHRNLKREAYGRRLDVRRSTVVGEELVPVSQRHEQEHGCDVIVSSFLKRMDSMIRSNTCQNAVLTRNVIFSCSSQSGPSNLHTSLKIRRRQSEQQSHENFVDIVNNTEVNDDVLEKNNLTVYVKTINKKTISICYYDSMKAAVMLEEVERRTTIPRDMTRLTHKGKAINGKKSMKDNNIKANETIEMSMRLLGGMEVNEQMDTHETEEDREKQRKLDEGKEGKATKPSDDMAHLRKDIMEALKKIRRKYGMLLQKE